jgi:glycerophosphoryl diester phosphodiesterase
VTPALIAHRGEPASFPENSIAGYRAVLQAGARWIETDVQITNDGMPILSHNGSLQKITGHDLAITSNDYETMRDLPAGYPERFADRFRQLRIGRLDEFAELLSQWPLTRAFVELKQPSLDDHGFQRCIDLVLQALTPCRSQCILISFEHAALQQVRRCCDLPIAWVLPEWSPERRRQATELKPEFLFCNRKRLPVDLQQLWPGTWTWAIYTVNTLQDAERFAALGAGMVETDIIRTLMGQGGRGD